MPRYYRENFYHHQIRFIKVFRRFVLIVFIALLCGGAYIAYDVFRNRSHADQPSAPTTLTKSTFASSFEVYRTEYFQFQASKSWSAISNESTANKFVYRKFDKTLVEAQLDIYINQPADQKIDANRVLPVTFNAAVDTIQATEVSGICSTEVKNRGYKPMVLAGVNFRCNTDMTSFSVLVGKVGGTTQLTMKRPNGSSVQYVIHFRDLRAIATPQELATIMDTFQTR